MAPCFEESGRIERLTVPGALGFQPSCATSRNHSPKRTAVSIRAPEGARAFKAQCRAACSLSAGRRGVEPRCVDLESALLAEGQPSDRWTARGSNPPRVACKASLHPSARPWRRTSRGRLSPGVHVPASSERQDSNLHGLGSRPSSHPLTHALSSLGSRRGSNPHLPVHSGMCRTTTSTATTSSPTSIQTRVCRVKAGRPFHWTTGDRGPPVENRTRVVPQLGIGPSSHRLQRRAMTTSASGASAAVFPPPPSRLLFSFHRSGRKRSAVVGLLGVEPSSSG